MLTAVEPPQTRVLKSDHIKLIPFGDELDFLYLDRLWREYPLNTFPTEQVRSFYKNHGRYFWTAYTDQGIKAGATYLSYYKSPTKDMWTITGFGDRLHTVGIRNKMTYLVDAGQLAAEFASEFTDKLYTFHNVKLKSVLRLYEQLGFKFVGYVDGVEGRHGAYMKELTHG